MYCSSHFPNCHSSAPGETEETQEAGANCEWNFESFVSIDALHSLHSETSMSYCGVTVSFPLRGSYVEDSRDQKQKNWWVVLW